MIDNERIYFLGLINLFSILIGYALYSTYANPLCWLFAIPINLLLQILFYLYYKMDFDKFIILVVTILIIIDIIVFIIAYTK